MIQPPHSGERPQWCQVQAVYSIPPSSGHRQHSQLGSEECQPPVSPHHEWLMVASTVCTHSPATRSGQLKMFKKTAVEKRLRKISKQEAASVKLLEKQVDVDELDK